jgi:hypothetical protein
MQMKLSHKFFNDGIPVDGCIFRVERGWGWEGGGGLKDGRMKKLMKNCKLYCNIFLTRC